MASKIIGIDLGTTNSCVALMEGGKPIVVPNAEGSRTTPSVVAFNEKGEILVGQVAKRQAVTNATNTIHAAKRLMGKQLNDPDIAEDSKRAAFELVASDRGDAWIKALDKEYSPAEIGSYVLRQLKQVAEDYLGESVEQAVITVPAYFNDSQRQATRDAGMLAGLEVLRIINEPTAEALAYGLDRKDEKTHTIAVYDLGGGTFDISILELRDGVFNVVATNGDTHLGGEDFDQIIATHLCFDFLEKYDIDLDADPAALQRIREASEKAKHELSSSVETEVNLPFIGADAEGPKHLAQELTRSELEDLTSLLVERSLDPCRKALDDAGKEPEDIDDVLLVGGMTRMPLVQKRVSDFFKRQPNRNINPDEVVAIGAAVQGAVLTGDVEDLLLLDVTPLTLGVETAGGVSTPVIERNTTVPTKKTKVFSTAQDNQPTVNVHVIQGERPMAEDNTTLGRFELIDIPPAPRGVPQIEVTFEIDANGIVNVGAKDLGTGKAQSVKINAQGGLNEDEIASILAKADENRGDDEQRRALADHVNKAQGLLYSTNRSLEEYREYLEATDLELIEADVEMLSAAIKNTDVQLIERAYQALEGSAYRIAEAMYELEDDDS